MTYHLLGLVLTGLALGWLLHRAGIVGVALFEDGVTPHAGYLRYVLLHKLYVYRAGRMLGVRRWRLLVHDATKFSRAEWRPYVRSFHGYKSKFAPGTAEQSIEQATVKARFQVAWLHHIHCNPHHWEHWVIPGVASSVVLTQEQALAAEMLADWIGAGQKINARPSLGACVIETVRWYAQNAGRMHLRQVPREFVEGALVDLAQRVTTDDARAAYDR